ncbi:ankyrin repeat-containing domain protein, partial [Tuber indicum]
LLECGVDPNTLDERGRTPLVCATAGRFGGAVRALLGDARVDVNRSCIFPDFTALHLAVWTGYDDIVQLLLECPRMDVNRVDNIQRSVLETIAHDRNNGIQHISVSDITAIVRIPLRRGWAPIHGAVAQHDCRILRTLLRHAGLDVNVLSMRGETPLWMSVSRNNLFAVLLLLAQPKTQIYLGVQPILHFAILCAKEDMIEILLECKRIDVNLVDGNQRTALHIAASIGRIDAIRLLLARSDIDAAKLDERGFSARDLA